jgi:hypothetical protein
MLQVFIPYHRYVFFLKRLRLSAAVLFTVHVPWGEVALCRVWPSFTPESDAAAVVVGVFGTTISPYLSLQTDTDKVNSREVRCAVTIERGFYRAAVSAPLKLAE